MIILTGLLGFSIYMSCCPPKTMSEYILEQEIKEEKQILKYEEELW